MPLVSPAVNRASTASLLACVSLCVLPVCLSVCLLVRATLWMVLRVGIGFRLKLGSSLQSYLSWSEQDLGV